MSDDLVKRLRDLATSRQGLERFDTLEDEAADRIEALTAALEKADALAQLCELFADGKLYSMDPVLRARAAYRAAREEVK